MSTNQANLFTYSNAEDPVVREVRPVAYPRQRDKYVGFVGPSNHGNAVVCQRNRHPNPKTGEQHYYRKLGGYSFSTPTLSLLDSIGVEVVFIEEIDNDRVLQYSLEQFILDGIETEEIEGDTQMCLTISDAIFEWPRSRTTILKKDGTERGPEALF
ncbi:hypothetical protein [Haloferax larsenii]|uniref:Uncharacterized protein n=1 Tax=Haloferax larsenii TaxID=302484 RepID=A0A1H7N9D3_HALLR|nr:hypothetical protein [Haloferax larsenii]SEL20080.1 hypothetical protein SAMN04488691_103232 [Haloferax larsenii]